MFGVHHVVVVYGRFENNAKQGIVNLSLPIVKRSLLTILSLKLKSVYPGGVWDTSIGGFGRMAYIIYIYVCTESLYIVERFAIPPPTCVIGSFCERRVDKMMLEVFGVGVGAMCKMFL